MRMLLLALAVLAAGLGTGSGLARAADPDPERGGKLFKRYCAGCHGADGRGGAHTFMPHIENLTKQGYVENLPDEYLVQVITEGGVAVNKSSYMPAWGTTLTPEQIADLVAYIRRLPSY